MPFTPGKSGNPDGKPLGTKHSATKWKHLSLKQICRKLTTDYALDALEHHLKKNNLEAVKIVVEHGWGKPIQQVHQVNVNMNYSSWTDEQIEEFAETGQMPMIQGEQEGDRPTKDTKRALNDKNKEVK